MRKSENPSEEKLLSRLKRLGKGNRIKTYTVVVRYNQYDESFYNLTKSDERDAFYAAMMEWSLSHSIRMVKENFFLMLFLTPSEDFQTNITLDVIDLICQKINELNERNERTKAEHYTLERWEAFSIGLSA